MTSSTSLMDSAMTEPTSASPDIMQAQASMASIQDAIVAEFEAFKDWDSRYKHLIQLGKALPNLPDTDKTEDNIVKGCQSQVWMITELKPDGNLYFYADSDAMIVRGLIALLLRVYSGHPPKAIMATRPSFIDRIQMTQHISAQRSNGLHAMIKQIQFYALAYQMKLEQPQ